jgi:hypothetical protein
MITSICFIVLTGLNWSDSETKMLIPMHRVSYVKKLGKDKHSTIKVDGKMNDEYFEIKESADEVAQIIKKECK